MKRIYLIIYSFLLFVLSFIIFFRPITAINEDLGRHILLGKIIFNTRQVPKVNLLSYSHPNHPFINTHWLSEVVYYTVSQIGGFDLLLVINTIVIYSAFLILLVFAARSYSKSAILIVLTLYIFLIIPRTDIRPEIFSTIFIALFVTTLGSLRKNIIKATFLLFFIELLWVNTHIYFFIGPALVGIYLLDSLFSSGLHISSRVKQFCYLLGAVLLATLFNPNGVKGALVPFTVFQNYGFPVLENESIFTIFTIFHEQSILFPLLVIVSLLVLMLFMWRHVKRLDWLIVIPFSLAAVLVFRNIIPFIFATFLIYVFVLDLYIKKWSPLLKSLPSKPLIFLYPLSLFMMLLIIYQAYMGFSVGFGAKIHAKDAVDFIQNNNIDGNLFNDFNIGGYLSYRLYPRLIYVDNRPEAYPQLFPKDIYLPMLKDPKIFETENNKYRFNGVILSYWDKTPFKNELLSYLLNGSDYVLVYLDYYSVVLVHKSNKELINEFRIKKSDISFEKIDDPEMLMHYLFFFEKIGWIDKSKEVLVQLKSIDPQLCTLSKFTVLKYYKTSFFTRVEINANCPQNKSGGIYSQTPSLDWMQF